MADEKQTAKKHFIDEELEELNRQYPVERIMGDYRGFWNNENYGARKVLMFGSYAYRCENAQFFTALAYAAAQEGKWVGFHFGDKETLEKLLKNPKEYDDFSQGMLREILGRDSPLRLAYSEGQAYLMPTKTFLDYVYSLQKSITIVKDGERYNAPDHSRGIEKIIDFIQGVAKK